MVWGVSMDRSLAIFILSHMFHVLCCLHASKQLVMTSYQGLYFPAYPGFADFLSI